MKIKILLNPNAVPKILEKAKDLIEENKEGPGMRLFLTRLAKGDYDEEMLKDHRNLPIELEVPEGSVLMKLHKLNDLEYDKLDNSLLDGLQNLQHQIGEELHLLLAPLKKEPRLQPHLFNENLWDYLCFSYFRNYLIARWLNGQKEREYYNFKQRFCNSPGTSVHPSMSQRARHGLFRLYKGYDLVRDLDENEQKAMLNIEDTFVAHVERKLFYTSEKLTKASIKRIVSSGFKTSQIRAFTKLQLAMESSMFLWNMDVESIVALFNVELSDDLINTQA